MPTEQITESGRVSAAVVPPTALPEREDEERALRQVAIKEVERVRSFKLHVLVYLVMNLVIGGVWVLTEYQQDNTWPSRFADSNDTAGTWNPWFFWVLGVWTVVLVIDAVRTFGHRPPTEAEIQRELDRMTSRR